MKKSIVGRSPYLNPTPKKRELWVLIIVWRDWNNRPQVTKRTAASRDAGEALVQTYRRPLYYLLEQVGA